MTTPIEKIVDRQVGVVSSISPNEVEIDLDLEAPHSISMGTGQPQLFPRLNGFLLIPCKNGFIVGKVVWLSISPSSYPKRKGIQDFGILDLPFPLRKLKLHILGILKIQENQKKNELPYRFKRGVHLFPSLGDVVLLPDNEQLRAIIESGTDGNIKIGTCPSADNADVKIDANRLLGRHLAVLGNTGSGKSCTVSGLIKWSIEAAKAELKDKSPNARFIILDPNGEYSQPFSSFKPNIFKVEPSEEEKQLQVPCWFWNSHEWASITQASGKVQRPLLSKILRELKNSNEDIPIPFKHGLFDHNQLVKKLENDPLYKSQNFSIDPLIMRIETMFSDARMKGIVHDTEGIELSDWLNDYIGEDDNRHINIIDLSLVPQEIIDLVIAVVARMIFEALHRYKRKEKKTLPTVLVIEEAHTFIRKYRKDDESDSSIACCQIFEKIAKEGRKFGLGLIISSQRPAELSSTVLSQCNTFLLHRITNDKDQDFISRLIPDSLRGMIEELPALPSRYAYLLGWASEIPILTEISYLDKKERPRSDDPDFWKVWTREEEREVNWKDIADEWQGRSSESNNTPNNEEDENDVQKNTNNRSSPKFNDDIPF